MEANTLIEASLELASMLKPVIPSCDELGKARILVLYQTVLMHVLGAHKNRLQTSKYLKICTCPASQILLAYMGKKLIFTTNIKIFTCPAVQGTRKYERTSSIFEPWSH